MRGGPAAASGSALLEQVLGRVEAPLLDSDTGRA